MVVFPFQISVNGRIFDFPLPFISNNIRIAAIGFLDPENMGITVGTSLISCFSAVRVKWGEGKG